MSKNNEDGGTPLLNIVENRSLEDIDLNLMADPWSESDEDSDSNKDTPSKKNGPINDLGLVEKKLENLKNNMDEFSSEEKPESSISPTNQLSSKGPPKDNEMSSYHSSGGPPKDNEMSSYHSSGGPPKDNEMSSYHSSGGPPKDNEITSSSPKKHTLAPPPTYGPPKDNNSASPIMNSLSLTGTGTDKNNNNPLNGAYGSLYDPSKITAPTTYTRGRKSRQKPGKKFATHQIGRFDPEHMDTTSSSKKKEKEKKSSPKLPETSLIPEPVVSSTVISPDIPGIF